MLFSADIEGLLLELIDDAVLFMLFSIFIFISLEPRRFRVMLDVLDGIEFTVQAFDIAVIVALFLVVLPGFQPLYKLFIGCKSKFVYFSISLFWFFYNYDTASLY